MDFSKFQQNLATLVEARGITYVDLSIETNMATTTLHRYISGNRTPELPNLIRLAKYFNVSLDWLLGLCGDRYDIMPQELQDIANLYSIATQEDKQVIQTILSKYRKEE